MTLSYMPIMLWPEATQAEITASGGEAPSLTMLAADPAKASGAAVIVFPGGGYVVHAEHEAEPVAEWLAALGITAFILRYRLHPNYKHPAALHDAARAVRIVRSQASEFGVDPGRIGVLGFSAGGHLASMLSTQFSSADTLLPGHAETASARPDLQILLYPVISLFGSAGHNWCAEALFGPNADPQLLERFSSHTQVTPETPPAFLLHTADDDVSCMNSLLMAQALKGSGVPFELHLYERGGHGYGLAQADPYLAGWPTRCEAWLQAQGFISTPTAALSSTGQSAA